MRRDDRTSERRALGESSVVYWYARRDGHVILHVAGEGDMPDFGSVYDDPPWHDFQKAVVHEGVTSLGERAFHDRRGLEEVSLPSSLTRIGRECFAGCEGMKSVAWPPLVETVECGTFDGCRSLTTVVLSEGVRDILRDAFRDCVALCHVHIPATVRCLNSGAFAGVDLDGLDVSGDAFEVEDGCLYRGPLLLAVSQQRESITVRPGTIAVYSSALYGNDTVREEHLPTSLMWIDECAFAHCTNLARVYCDLEPARMNIGAGTFLHCPATIMSVARSASGLTPETGRIAVTERGYALLRDGRVSLSAECVDGDGTPLLRNDDFVDIQGGSDFVVGLRRTGEVVATTMGYAFGRAHGPFDGDPFPNGVSFPKNVAQLAAGEGRIAAIDDRGRLFHWQAHTLGQPSLWSLPASARSVSVGRDTLLIIDDRGRLRLLASRGLWSHDLKAHLVRWLREAKEKPEQCRIHDVGAGRPTVAVLTATGHLAWCPDVTKEPYVVPGLVGRFSIGKGVAAAVDHRGKVSVQFGDGTCVSVPADTQAVDVGLVRDEVLVVLYADGRDAVIALDELGQRSPVGIVS